MSGDNAVADQSAPDDGLDLAFELGAEALATVEKFSIYFPDCDRHNNPVPDFESWVDQAMLTLTDINGGVTRLPASIGMWNSQTGTLVKERTTIIYSYLMKPDQFVSRIKEIRQLVHDFGRETNQGEVLVEYAGAADGEAYVRSYSITAYDPPIEDATIERP